jgi:3-methyl-2-oxobutanoate hydroxymethyltransferase
MSSHNKTRGLTVHDITGMKGKQPVVVVTAYDALFGRLVDDAGVDVVLVGDSVGNVFAGHDSTLPVTLDQMIYHAEMVSRAARRAFVIGDLPFLSYQASVEQAILAAGRMLKETRCAAVKLEGGRVMAETIRALTQRGIPVVGHVGLTPQSVLGLGGYKVQRDGEALLADARAVADSGAFALVLECIPAEIAGRITAELPIPTIGIGAGPDCDGQVLVTPDMLGLFEGFHPKFVRRYAEMADAVRQAAAAYVADVTERRFPDESESFR